jgi:putative transposase
MDNHFHLIVQAPDANLSRAVQWLKVSYSMWFNAKYRRVGPLFQGWFKSVLVDSHESWLLELSFYVHLNPL